MTIPTATPTPAWDGAERVRDRDGDEWVRIPDGRYTPKTRGIAAQSIEEVFGPCTVVEPAPDTDEPRKTKVANCARCDRIEAHSIGNEALLARRRERLIKAKDEIVRLEARITELEADKPEPGPWLRGAELAAVMPTLKAGDVVEVDYGGHTATGELWADDRGLVLWACIVRYPHRRHSAAVHALRVIERAPEPEPEPGADIPDEVVKAALAAIPWASDQQLTDVRAALAAADAKRAELAGGEQA